MKWSLLEDFIGTHKEEEKWQSTQTLEVSIPSSTFRPNVLTEQITEVVDEIFEFCT
jgi:hypothetical protein